MRCFAALALPDAVVSELVLVQHRLPPLPRLLPPENMHLTLAFFGEVDGPALDELHDALETLRAPGFELQLAGLDLFGGAAPRNVHVGVAPCAGLEHLQRKVVTAARRAGVAVEKRRFVPHVTLARLPGTGAAPPGLGAAVAGLSGFRSAAFRVTGFGLFRSHLRRDGAVYDLVAEYPLLAA